MTLLTGDRPQRLVVNGQAGFEIRPFGSRNVAPAARDMEFRTVGTYRLYCLDGVDKVASAEWIDLDAEIARGAIEHRDDDDAAAIEIAERLSRGRTCELWQNSRLVARLNSAPPG